MMPQNLIMQLRNEWAKITCPAECLTTIGKTLKKEKREEKEKIPLMWWDGECDI